MKTFLRRWRGLAALALATGPLLLHAGAAAAENWPTRPVTLIVPYGPGASNDLFTRALAEFLSKKFGQPFVVDNRPGANGFIGSSQGARAEPDGYTFVQNNNGIIAFGLTDKQIQFDVTKDLAPVALIAKSPSGIHVPASSPIRTVQDLVEAAKADPDNFFYGTLSPTSTQALQVERFNMLAGIKMKPVVYKSAADATLDLAAGRINVYFISVSTTIGQIEANQIRLIAYTGAGAPPTAPQAPTVEEAGIAGFDSQLWWGLWAPNGTPADIIQKMNEATNEALKDPAIVELMAKSGATPSPATPEEFGTFVTDVRNEMAELIETLGIEIK